jgi:glycosyltransferase involved in cell wall biosynthesis
MKILFFSHYFPPEVGAPAARVYEHAKFWVRSGHSVTVVTGFPNHPTGIIPKEYRGKIILKESIEGINVLRTWLLASANKGFKKRSVSFLTSMLSSIIFSLSPKIEADVIIGSSPQLLTPLAAYIVSRIKKKPFVLEVRDLWPQVIVELELVKEGRIIKWLRKLELFLYKKADRIIVVSKSFKDYIVERGVEADKIDFIPNGVDLSLFNQEIDREKIRNKLGIQNKYVVLYGGNHGMAQGLDVAIKAAAILKEDKRYYFLLVGDGPEKEMLQEMAARLRLKNVEFIPTKPHNEIIEFYKAADVCLVPLKNLELLTKFIPSKIFEIMSCGKPVIAALAGEAQKIVEASGGGISVPPGEPNKLAEAIICLSKDKELANKLARSGKMFVSEHYNREMLAVKYVEVLREVVLKGEYLRQVKSDIKLSVVLINHNAKKHTANCISSIVEKTSKAHEIILVDNSSDKNLQDISQNFPFVKRVQNDKNHGFARSSNQGIKLASGKYIILLNNDTVLKNNALDIMVDFMENNIKVGVLTCKLYEGSENIQKNCRSFYSRSFDTLFGRASLITKIFPDNPISRRNILSNWDYNSAREVDWVSGACMMIRRELLENIGLLDENFHMYWEDTDFCKRAYYYFLKHHYKHPLHPMAGLTFLGMLLLIFIKTVNEIFATIFLSDHITQSRPSLWIINQCFHPDIDATAQIMTDLAEDLVDRGIRVTVITGRNNNSYGKRETYNGINIIRVGVLKLSKKILFFRYLNYISLFPSILFKSVFLRKPDYILVVSSPPFIFFLGSLLKTLRRSKLILNVQDLYPDVAVKLNLLKNPALIKVLEYFTRRLYQKAHKIICISENMRNRLIQKECPGEKIEVIHNWADRKLLHPLTKDGNSFVLKHKLSNKFVLQYAGNFGMVQEMDTILESANHLKSNQNILFILIGDGVQANKIRSFISENRLGNVMMIPYQKRELINFSLNACDVSFVTLKDSFQGAVVPSKVYSTMATGKPVLGVCPKGSEIEEIVDENKCGVVLQPGDFKGCAEKILYLYNNPEDRELMGKNALKGFLEKYERSIATRRYFEIISRI